MSPVTVELRAGAVHWEKSESRKPPSKSAKMVGNNNIEMKIGDKQIPEMAFTFGWSAPNNLLNSTRPSA
jgi:hypothetical protein